MSLLGSLSLIGCASEGMNSVREPSGLESYDSPAPQDGPGAKLTEILKANGYQGAGLRYESPKTIDTLIQVFSDSRTAGRQIAVVYTGIGMSYDENYKSLTVGGTADVETMVNFIDKHIPLKPEITKTP